uniref:Uncharacterized protein n=1 Tax=Avena sativa TaxID=4498 RepID=A0ACD6AAT7_AVESA
MTQWVLVGKKDGVAVMDIDNVCYGEESTYYSEPELREDMKPTNDETSKVIAGSSSELPTLDVHPLELCFPYAPNMSICCPLQLTNTTNERAAFRLMDKSAKTELYDIVPPKSTYTLIVTREENSSMKLVGETEFHLLLQSCTLGDRYIVMFTSQSECDEFFEEAQELGNNVHEVTLKCVYVPQGDLMFKEAVCIHTLDIMSPVISVIPLPHRRPYIVTGSNHGTVQLWSSTDFSLTRTVNFGGGGPVRGLCSMGSRSVVIGQEKRITIMDIDKDAATWKKIFPLSLNNPPKIFSSIKETLIDTVSPCSRFSS